MKTIQKSLILSEVVMILLGAFMLVWPNIVSRGICYFIGVILLFFGVNQIITYKKLTKVGFFSKVTLLFAICVMLLGVALFIRPDFFSSIIPILVGIYVILEAINDFMAFTNTKNMPYLIRSILLLLFGILLFINPFSATQVFIRVIGIYLIVDSVSQIYFFSK